MKNKKNVKIWTLLITICFLTISGTLYTVFYLKPSKEEVVLLNDGQSSIDLSEDLDQSADPSEDEKTDEISPNITQQNLIYVHICGEVMQPGVYEVTSDVRLNDVVHMAGGLTNDAAAEYVNLAQIVEDGKQYVIPSYDSVTQNAQQQDLVTTSEQTTATNENGLININTATIAELMTLPGVGEAKAGAIITYREQVSSYSSIEDIMNVEGIKEGLFSKIKEKITV